MQKLIHHAVNNALTRRPMRRLDKQLWVSDLGKNPYGAIRRIVTGELEEFDYPTLLKMDGGNALEAFSLRQAAEGLESKVITQFPLFNDIWTGYADLVINPYTDDPIIYDHKGSAGKWWDYRESLPRTSDCCQVWLYGQLYQEMYGIAPRLGLYYRGWGAWAEFEIKEVRTLISNTVYLTANGNITDEKGVTENEVSRVRKVNPYWLKWEIEKLYQLARDNKKALEDLVIDPGGPDWDYAENAMARLEEVYFPQMTSDWMANKAA